MAIFKLKLRAILNSKNFKFYKRLFSKLERVRVIAYRTACDAVIN